MFADMRLRRGLLYLWCCVAGVSIAFRADATYHFPLGPAFRSLAGTFGELRNNHFHGGIDIRCGGATGEPVYAVEDGHLERMQISCTGYGKSAHVRHRDGNLSVYAHLSGFAPHIEAWLYEQQAISRQYEQNLQLGLMAFPVRKGELIAYTGNTGFSHGPHLHFEIRDPEGYHVDPLRFFRQEIPDDLPPVLQQIAFEPLTANSRVNGCFEKELLSPQGGSGYYRLVQPIEINGPVGIEYRGYDQLCNSSYTGGISQARLFLDGVLIYDMRLSRFHPDAQRQINAHIDYGHYRRNNRRLEKAYIDEGNQLAFCSDPSRNGVIQLQDDRQHNFQLELADGYGNVTRVEGVLQRGRNTPQAYTPPANPAPNVNWEIRRNVMVFTATNAPQSWMNGLSYRTVMGDELTLLPAYAQQNRIVFLLPLSRLQYPRKVEAPQGGTLAEFYFKDELQPGRNTLLTVEEMQCLIPEEAALSRGPLALRKRPPVSGAYSALYELGHPDIPLGASFLLSFRPAQPGPSRYMFIARRNDDNAKWEFAGARRDESGALQALAYQMGSFCVMADSTPPSITPVNFRVGRRLSSAQSTLRIKVSDDLSGVDSRAIYGYIDGVWVLFEYDLKSRTITHNFRNRPPAGTHRLEVEVSDKLGNRRKAEWSLLF